MIHDMENDIKLPLMKDADRVTALEGPGNGLHPLTLSSPVTGRRRLPMHLMVKAYVNYRLKDQELLDDNEEAGYLCEDSSHCLPEQMQCIISNWGQQAWV